MLDRQHAGCQCRGKCWAGVTTWRYHSTWLSAGGRETTHRAIQARTSSLPHGVRLSVGDGCMVSEDKGFSFFLSSVTARSSQSTFDSREGLLWSACLTCLSLSSPALCVCLLCAIPTAMFFLSPTLYVPKSCSQHPRAVFA